MKLKNGFAIATAWLLPGAFPGFAIGVPGQHLLARNQPRKRRMTIFQTTLRAGALCATLLLGLAISCLPAAAQATYIYTGNNFTLFAGGTLTSSDHISATMQLTDRLPSSQWCINPTGLPGFSLTMTDGKNGTATWPGNAFQRVWVSTDSSGQVIAPWVLEISYTDPSGQNRHMFSANSAGCGSHVGVDDISFVSFADYGRVLNHAGVWSYPSATLLTTMLKTQFQLGNLPDIGTSFADQLQQIANDIATNNGQACQDLQSFASHIKAQAGKKLTQPQVDSILQTVAQIAAQLNCTI